MSLQSRLDAPAILLHWTVGATILFLLGTGLYMVATESWNLYPVHKSVGVLLVVVAAVRAWRRLRAGWPAPVGTYHRLEQRLAKVTHWALLVGTLAVPVSGMAYSALSGHGFGVFGLVTIVPSNHDAVDPAVVVPYWEWGALAAQRLHQILAYVLAGAIALHVAGALKHHLVDRDGTLRRMLGRSVP